MVLWSTLKGEKFVIKKRQQWEAAIRSHLKVRELNIILKLKFPNFSRLGFFSTCHQKTWMYAAAAAAKSPQSCPTLCNPIDGSPPGSTVPGILQARTLEWVAISFSSAWKWKLKVKSLSRVRLLANPWSAAYQAPPSMGFSRQEYWSGVPLPSPLECITIIRNTNSFTALCFLSLSSSKKFNKSFHCLH